MSEREGGREPLIDGSPLARLHGLIKNRIEGSDLSEDAKERIQRLVYRANGAFVEVATNSEMRHMPGLTHERPHSLRFRARTWLDGGGEGVHIQGHVGPERGMYFSSLLGETSFSEEQVMQSVESILNDSEARVLATEVTYHDL